jgi:hypothetical protein
MESFNTINGRPVVNGPPISERFKLFSRIPVDQSSSLRTPVGGLWDTSLLSSAFFSVKNVAILQNGIRRGVYDLSSGKLLIDPQDLEILNVIMRSVFIQNANEEHRNFAVQIRTMNKLVISYCTDQIYGEAQGRLHYLHDIDTIATPLSHPIMTTTENELIFKSWF